MKKQGIVLNGPSSSGKSTLAKALSKSIYERLGQVFEIISIDDYLQMNTRDVIYEEDVFAISAQLCQGVSDALGRSDGVIIDHVMTSQRIFEQLIQGLASHTLHLVQVHCPLEELERRERERKNRRLGSARASYEYLFPQEGYALTVDTFCQSPQECVLEILKLL